MDRRSVCFGAGVGIVFITFIFFIGLKFAGTPEVQIETVTEAMNDEQIIEAARKLGMVMVKELPESPGTTGVSGEDGQYREIMERIEELEGILAEAEAQGYIGLGEPLPADAGPATDLTPSRVPDPSTSIASAQTPTPSPGAQIALNPTPSPASEIMSTPTPPSATGAASTPSPPSGAGLAATPAPSAIPDDYTTVTIPSGGNSISISTILSNNGVVDSANDFNWYVINNGKSTKLIAGVYDIPKDATYDEILEIITGSPATE